ncbi:MAG: flavodoxin family protein [Anaerolineaceae bacterium]|nr:flavodoxin family protein [Anaerolineaceae bacterium]
MKILVILGSGRKNGNTDLACGIIREELEKIAAAQAVPLEIETIPLGMAKITACRGCRSCFDRGEDRCPYKDDLAGVREKMRAADGLLITSPVYVDDVSGLVKNWIDRIAHACHRPEFCGKCAYALVTTGGSSTGHALRTLTIALSTWGYHIVGKQGLATGARMKPEEMRTQYQVRLQKIAQQFFKALHERQFARPTFFSLMMFRIQQIGWKQADPETVDFHYWESKGWFEPSCDFYIPHQGNPLKTVIARATGTLISRFVS